MTAALWPMVGEPPTTVQLDNFVTKHAFALQGVLFHDVFRSDDEIL